MEKLASYLDNNKLRITRSQFLLVSSDDFKLLTRKSVFPYGYVDNFHWLNETRLLSYKLFYNSLTGEITSESDYCHVVDVWERFGINNLGEYSDLYLKTDVLLLADI